MKITKNFRYCRCYGRKNLYKLRRDQTGDHGNKQSGIEKNDLFYSTHAVFFLFARIKINKLMLKRSLSSELCMLIYAANIKFLTRVSIPIQRVTPCRVMSSVKSTIMSIASRTDPSFDFTQLDKWSKLVATQLNWCNLNWSGEDTCESKKWKNLLMFQSDTRICNSASQFFASTKPSMSGNNDPLACEIQVQ